MPFGKKFFFFKLPCDPSVATDDRAVEHPRELQSKLIESREIEHDLKAKDLLLEINVITPLTLQKTKQPTVKVSYQVLKPCTYLFARVVKRTTNFPINIDNTFGIFWYHFCRRLDYIVKAYLLKQIK